MRRNEKGIFGVKKDPKNLMLFSFQVREGEEWPSSDSGDSDYQPSDDETKKPTTKTKPSVRKKSNNKRSSKKVKISSSTTTKSSSDVKPTKYEAAVSCSNLPSEIWLKIFQDVVRTSGSLPFLCRAARVCTLWRDLCTHQSLWRSVDLSYGWIKSTDRTLQWLCDNRLEHTQEISLSGWKNLTSASVKDLMVKCCDLTSINLSYCGKVNTDGWMSLANNCSGLSDIDVSFSSIQVPAVKVLVEKCGKNLRQLNVGGNNLTGFNSVLTALKKCPNLQLLDVSNVRFSSDFMAFDIEKFQHACPKMRVLRLANSKFRAPEASRRIQNESPGFPDLEELSLAVHTAKVGAGLAIHDNFYQRILKASCNLRLLDLRGLSQITTLGLASLPVTDLESLYLSMTSLASRNNNVDVVLHKWRHSLKVVDLSWNTFQDNVLDTAFEVYVGLPTTSKHKLRWINFAGTAVTLTTVKLLLDNCPDLEYINLSSCRGLPRGMKREYSQGQISQLRKEVRIEVQSNNSDSTDSD
ncbi:F-box/LRR-repeat protein 6-like [Pecten maximus]|uniref:F-box/LRR-repeat protein 6-like n=1 Tax=Pecten maximus TaxID=6579 RepID=UPI001458E6E3|nr:F-box/LRR-repeat protein 6-like [Pecten maximus]XP_033732271.1 F-box/LRR-repeat protein 6-like [Pecten maximus]